MEKREKQHKRVRKTQHESRRQERRKRKLRRENASRFNKTTWGRDYNKILYRRLFSYTRHEFDE